MNAYSSPSVDADRLRILRLREERATLSLEREYLDSEGRVIALKGANMGSFSGNFYSEELKTTTRINLILPDASNDVTPLLGGTPKLLFLLHGLGGNCDEWLRFSKIEYYAKKINLIVVMPEAQRSFYCDYPTAPRYFHYVADELPQLCEQWFAPRRPREDWRRTENSIKESYYEF